MSEWWNASMSVLLYCKIMALISLNFIGKTYLKCRIIESTVVVLTSRGLYPRQDVIITWVNFTMLLGKALTIEKLEHQKVGNFHRNYSNRTQTLRRINPTTKFGEMYQTCNLIIFDNYPSFYITSNWMKI